MTFAANIFLLRGNMAVLAPPSAANITQPPKQHRQRHQPQFLTFDLYNIDHESLTSTSTSGI